MSFHTIAWAEGIAASGTLQPIAAVADDQVFTSGDDFRVPTGLANLLAAWAIGEGATRARIVAPSLRAFVNAELSPKNLSEAVGDAMPHRLHTWMRAPLPLAVGEFVNFESDGGAAGPNDVSCIALVGDGPVVQRDGEIRTVRATAAIVGTRIVWTSGGIVFSEDLPAGRYAVVGGRCEADNPGAFRLIFREGGPRPGALAVGTASAGDTHGQRLGGWGVWGEFDINQPPTLEILSLGAAGSAQTLYLDLMRV